MIVSHIDECKWEHRKEHGNFRWKYLADSTQFNSHGLSCGILVLPPGEELKLHHHVPQEIYLIRKGEGHLLKYDSEQNTLGKIVLFISQKTARMV